MSADTLTICCHQEANLITAVRVAELCRKVRIWSKLPASCDASAPVCLSFPNIKLTHPLRRLVHPPFCCFPASSQLMNFKKTSKVTPSRNAGMLIKAQKNCFGVVVVVVVLFFFQCLTFRAGISTVSLMARDPWRTVPVMTVPWPRMEKQWSTAISRSPPGSLWGRYVCFFKSWTQKR